METERTGRNKGLQAAVFFFDRKRGSESANDNKGC